MAGGIYLVRGDGGLVAMSEQDYASEGLLQALLADHPDLLAGDQIDAGEPRRWVLVSREMPLASEEDGSGRWSVDHLFLDQDAVPTIVEVKRSTDTRIRREVVGQMLDYAANAVVYWPVEALRARFEGNERDHEGTLAALLGGPETDAEEFWRKVKTNLQAGKVRLVFVADKIPDELRRIVEFLNGQMDPAEVLAVEIKQYVGGDFKTLVPRVIGQTVGAQQKKTGAARRGKQWDESSFFEDLQARRGADEAKVAREILEWARTKLPRFTWTQGEDNGWFVPVLDHEGAPFYPLALHTHGKLQVQFQYMRARPFDDEGMRRELLRRLNEIEGIAIPEDKITKRPSIPFSTLRNGNALERFLEVFDWYVGQVEAS
ncbi:MAG: hypothetical protein M3P49_15505 [Actinomycetota bacterium]|nr:hypothetical protein [Actinomycetota bacterium]